MDDDISAGIGQRIAGMCLAPLLAFASLAVLAVRQLDGRPEQSIFIAVAVLGALVTAIGGVLTIRSVGSMLSDAHQRSEILARRELAPTRWQLSSDHDIMSDPGEEVRFDQAATEQDRNLANTARLNEQPMHAVDAAHALGDHPAAPEQPDGSQPIVDRALTAPSSVSPRSASSADESPSSSSSSAADLATASAMNGSPDGVTGTESARVAPVVRNLVKRIQAMLDRQIDLVDELESKEEDPVYLEKLFKIDHLANRMRRTADGLLVLAGADLDRRLGGPVPVLDVLRVSIGEVEDHRRVTTARAETASVSAGSALPLAHLAAELIENAIEFSPPTAGVEVIGRRSSTQSPAAYEILIADQGIGMSEAQLAEMNRLLTDPPDLSTLSGHAMGLSVVGHLARRLGAVVDLSGNGAGGVTASIQLPLAVLDGTTSGAAEGLDNADSVQAGSAVEGRGPAAVPPLPPKSPERRNDFARAERMRLSDDTGALPPLSPVSTDLAVAELGASGSLGEGPLEHMPSGLPVLDRERLGSPERLMGEEVGLSDLANEHRPPSRPSHRNPDEIEDMLRRYRQGQQGLEPTSSERHGER